MAKLDNEKLIILVYLPEPKKTYRDVTRKANTWQVIRELQSANYPQPDSMWMQRM